MLEERSRAKNYCPVSLLSVVSKVFEKLVNNRIVDHFEKRGLFPDFQHGFRSSQSTADLLTVVSDKIARAFHRSGATRAVSLDIPKASEFDMLVFWNLGLMEFQIRYLALLLLFSVIGGFGWFWMVSVYKNIQLMLEFLRAPLLVLHFSYYTLMTFLMMLSKCDQASDLWQQLELASETLWTGTRSDLLISILGKLNWFRLNRLITLVLLM